MESIDTCEVQAGEYLVGDDTIAASRPSHRVSLAAYAIGRTEVTNAQYVAFVEADAYQDESLWTTMGWRWHESGDNRIPAFWHDPQFNDSDQPVVGVSWYEADAFTHWLARETGLPWRLPTEVEWEAAARGPDDEAPSPRLYNTVERRLGRPWPVTAETNISWCGAVDLCGNVWEWCSSRWGRNWQTMDYRYPYDYANNRESAEGSYARVMRGGSWFDPLTEANPANRGRYLPGSRGSNIGFRLARSLE